MSLARWLLSEMALDLGNNPPFDPGKRRRIERGNHPYSENPAWKEEIDPAEKQGGIENYAELVTSDQYPRIINKISDLTGVPVSQIGRNPGSLMMTMMQSLQQSMQWQAAHKDELERKAINLVLQMPQFADAAKAYVDGDLLIEAKLVDQVSMRDMEVEPEEPDEEMQQDLQVAEIAQELDAEKLKRRFMNLLTQGAAINQNFLHEKIEDFLNQINPQLLKSYSLATALAELNYWMMPSEQQEEMYRMAKAAGQGAGGRSEVEFNQPDGTPLIKAEALILPVLIQELVKGLMEYMAYTGNEFGDAATQKHIYNEADTLENETWDIMMGPAVWRKLERVVGEGNEKYLTWLHNHLATLPASEFNRIVPEIVRATPEGEAYVQNLISQWSQEEEAPEDESF